MAVSSNLLKPVGSPERIVPMDILRGVAVLGILAMNIQSFAMPSAAYSNPTAFENLKGYDLWVWVLSHVFADQKFMSIFSMLFGASIMMLSQKARKENLRSTELQNRRFIFLALIGLGHAYFLWYGDILFAYAVCGFFMFSFRNKKTKVQIRAGIALLVVGSLISLVIGYTTPYWEPGELERTKMEIWTPDKESIAEEIEFSTGSWERQLLFRSGQSFQMQTTIFLFETFWRVSGLMLIGMALFKRRVFKGKQGSRYYGKMIAYGLGVGLSLVVIGLILDFHYKWDFQYSFFFFTQLNYWGSVLMALGYVGIIMLLTKDSTRSFLAKKIAAVGRTALSTYLLQSIICGFIFYGHGLGLFGDLDRSAQAVLVLAIWVFNIAFSNIWLSYFRYGPFEWLWRSLSYGKFQPLMKD
ncbi:DUF418 domain-containing protein [Roseivirga misakiensis]|uniref:DUF418 domain-containing protein n=1 Tax=Roseivirga misakiensis TaxID=1563681 RepID=A0A1E5T6R2_9BACT|nr:DUF418 domain-containing protein [Roseivirga misakiensis]OEK07069.1 hypothetical protein BFP71_05270 [Roseivirga misakiensis]